MRSIIIPADDKTKDIDWDEVVKKEARGINDADFGDKNRFYLPKNIVYRFDGHIPWFNLKGDEANNTYRNIEEIM